MKRFIVLVILIMAIDQGMCVEVESLKSAIKATLGPIKAAAKRSVTHNNQTFDVYFDKTRPTQFAVVQSRVYPPNCTHTWVIGLNDKAVVKNIRMVEYSCPHAKPATKKSYFQQYMGKGPADVMSLKSSIQTIAKATGSCDLTTDSVVTSIEAIAKVKSTL